jgi:hypothetical protein
VIYGYGREIAPGKTVRHSTCRISDNFFFSPSTRLWLSLEDGVRSIEVELQVMDLARGVAHADGSCEDTVHKQQGRLAVN